MVEFWKPKGRVWYQKNDDKKLGKKVPAHETRERKDESSRYSEDNDDYDNRSTPWELKSEEERERIKARSKLRGQRHD